MRKIFKILLAFLIIGIAGYFFVKKDTYSHNNDLIIFGGDIITMKDSLDKIEAIYVKDGKIIETGTKEAIFKLKNSHTEVIDLQGKTLMPGFFDAHGHFDLATVFSDMVDISGVNHRNVEEVWNIVETTSKKGKPGEWIFFYGLDPPLTKGIQSPTIQYLDSIAPDKPIVIITKALHVFYANSAAFSSLGITEKTPNPSKASYYEKDANGKLSGGIIEQEALEPIRLKLQDIIKKNYVANTLKVLAEYGKNGVTSAVNMGLSNTNKNILNLYKHIAAEKPEAMTNALAWAGKLPKRTPNPRIFIYLRKEFDGFLPKTVENGDDFYKIMGIKMWYDGSPYSGSMFLKNPYTQSRFTINDIHLSPEHRSESLMKPVELENYIEKYQALGWKIAIHAQGDLANQEVIEVFEKIHKKQPFNERRHRLEHCMLLPKEMVGALKKMGISPSFHINHLYYYGEFLKSEIIGEERGERIFPIKSVVDMQIPYSLHADMPQFYPNPLSLANTSITRTTESGNIINAAQCVSAYQAMKSITIDAAWQLGMENKLGTLEKGKYADLVILDQNPLKINPNSIRKIKVLQTFVAGNRIFEMK